MKKTDTATCQRLTLRQTARFLKKHDNYIILTHASPDGDTLGSAYALYYALNEIGKVAEVICPDIIPLDANSIKADNVVIVLPKPTSRNKPALGCWIKKSLATI